MESAHYHTVNDLPESRLRNNEDVSALQHNLPPSSSDSAQIPSQSPTASETASSAPAQQMTNHLRRRKRTRNGSAFGWPAHPYQFHNAIFFLCTLFSVLLHQSGTVAGIYVEQYMNSPEVCSPASAISNKLAILAMEQIHLGNFPNHTVIMKLSRWQEKHSPTAFVNFRCRFEVTAPRDHGVMITIREMNFRRFSNKACQDFLKFKPEDRVPSDPVCGEVSASDKSMKPLNLVGKRFHYDPKGGLDVIINTGDYLPNQNKPILLEMVLTAYSKKCSPSNPLFYGAQECAPGVCIASSLFCDGVINCGHENNYGVDELGCPDPPAPGLSRGMGLLIFALSAIGTLLAVGVIVFAICCCCDGCSGKRPRNTSSRRRRRRRPTTAETHEQTSDTSDHALNLPQTGTLPPSAPPVIVDETVATETEIISPNAPKLEDLPPSYMELYPDHIVTGKI